MTDESDESIPPPNHPNWAPAGKYGHYCIAEHWCPCGHMNSRLNRATTRADGRKGAPNLDKIEGNDGSR